jgi:predicted acyl esterase
MRFTKLMICATLAVAVPLAAETHLQPAVQPGGDIPKSFHPTISPIPKGGDIPERFNPPRADFQYIRREVIIPMRDGVKLYAVLIMPRSSGSIERHIRPTRQRRGERSGLSRKTSYRRSPPNWFVRVTSSPTRTCAANISRAGIT